MNVAHYLDQLGKELATRGATSAQAASIEFNHDTDQIRVHVAESARVASYPDLAKVLERIGRLCLSDGQASGAGRVATLHVGWQRGRAIIPAARTLLRYGF